MICPQCKKDLIVDKQKGEAYCKECMLVVDDALIDRTPEFADEGKGEKRGYGEKFTHTKSDYGTSSVINRRDLRVLDPKTRRKMESMIRWSNRMKTAVEKNISTAMSEMKNVVAYLNLPKRVEEEAARIYKEAVVKGIAKGRAIESVVAGVIYAACKMHDLPRTFEEISDASKVEKKEIARTYKFVARELGIKILPTNPEDYISRFANSLRLSAKSQTETVKLLEKARKLGIVSGKCPTAAAAAALYIASLMNKEKRTQREVSEVSGVTEVTIRNRYNEFVRALKIRKKLKK